MDENQKGFSVVEGLLVLVIIALMGLVGWYVWQSNNKQEKNTTTSNQNQEPTTKVVTKTMTLTEKSVSFKVPETWIKGDVAGCVEGAPIFGNEKVLDSIRLLASKKQEGSNDPYFSVSVCIFDNPHKQTPQGWANSTDGGASIGYPSDNDKTSEESINGNPAFYMKFTSEEHGGNEDIYYVISANDKIIYVSARTLYDFSDTSYDEEFKDNAKRVWDFREYEPSIVELANSIVIK